jgi:hypothetical protein
MLNNYGWRAVGLHYGFRVRCERKRQRDYDYKQRRPSEINWKHDAEFWFL